MYRDYEHRGSYARQFRWLTVTTASLRLRLSRQVRSPIILNSVSRQRPLMHTYIKPRNTFLSTKRRSSPNQIIVLRCVLSICSLLIEYFYDICFRFLFNFIYEIILLSAAMHCEFPAH